MTVLAIVALVTHAMALAGGSAAAYVAIYAAVGVVTSAWFVHVMRKLDLPGFGEGRRWWETSLAAGAAGVVWPVYWAILLSAEREIRQ